MLVGLVGGMVTAAAAGARRTDSAFGRFLAATRAPDIFAYSSSGGPDVFQPSYQQLVQLPQAAAATSITGFQVVDPPDANVFVPGDTRLGPAVLLHKLLAGRQPRPDRADEVMVSFTLAQQHHLRVGSTLRVSLTGAGSGPDEPGADEQGAPPALPFSFRVVGIEASANEFPPQQGTGVNNAWATPAFLRSATATLGTYETVAVRLRNGARDVPAFEGEIQRLAGGRPATVTALADQRANTQRSIHLQAVALWLLAGLFALAAALVIAQLLTRQSHLESGEYPDLRALGMSRGQLWAVGMTRAVVIGGAGAALAVVAALLLSPLTPVGLARTAEPHPGLSADAVALGLGALATVALVVAAGAWPAWRAAAHAVGVAPTPSGQARPSLVADAMSRAGGPLPVTTGVRLALEPGRGRTAVPVRSTVTGAVIGVVALATALGFDASLNHLLGTPRLYGVTWDARVEDLASEDVGQALPAVLGDGDVTDVSLGQSRYPVSVGSVRVDGIAVAPERGAPLLPTPLAGRLPTQPDEVLLGGRTMAAMHARIGSTIRAVVADATPEPVPLRVVGQGVFPSLSDAMGLGKGLAMTPEGLSRMLPDGGGPPPNTILVRFRSGTDVSRAISELRGRVAAGGAFAVLPADRPVDLVNFGRVKTLPLVLGGLLGLFATATLAHLLVTSIRRRRRDLAVLKILGLAPGQVRSTVAWQSTTLALVAVLVGVPLGMAAGRSVWLLFAHQLGIVPEPVFPLLALGLLAVATLAVANVVAVLPGRAAARTQPALVLRSE
jgi:ABC-type lipoprotein release transport system permease subunit